MALNPAAGETPSAGPMLTSCPSFGWQRCRWFRFGVQRKEKTCCRMLTVISRIRGSAGVCSGERFRTRSEHSACTDGKARDGGEPTFET